jgi:hypothetical protein
MLSGSVLDASVTAALRRTMPPTTVITAAKIASHSPKPTEALASPEAELT